MLPLATRTARDGAATIESRRIPSPRPDKLEPLMMDVWASALRRDAQLRLWIATGAGNPTRRAQRGALRALRTEVGARGLRSSSILAADRAPTAEEHAGRISHCSLALDARRWGAHVTALDALWAGVAVITAPGEALAARAAHSLTHAIGLPTLSLHSLRSYSDVAAVLLASEASPSRHVSACAPVHVHTCCTPTSQGASVCRDRDGARCVVPPAVPPTVRGTALNGGAGGRVRRLPAPIHIEALEPDARL